MAHVILVHGMAANSRSWFGVPKALSDQGHVVVPVQLPGHHLSPENLGGMDVTMADYVEAVVDAFPKSGKCCLIGHSMGGFVISQVAAQYPDRVDRLIYVTAMLPADGETIQDIINRSGTSIANVIIEFTKHLPEALLAVAFQPIGPLNTGFTSTSGFRNIPRYYIRCSEDGILKPPLQDEMITQGAPIDVLHLISDHLPQLSVPDKLNARLIGILNGSAPKKQ